MRALLVLMISLAWAGAAAAQSPAGQGTPATARPGPATPHQPSAATPPGGGLPAPATAAQPSAAPSGGAQPASGAPRQPRSYQACNREAVARRYRGAERRHFVSRCQLGYGRRLFRPRNRPNPG